VVALAGATWIGASGAFGVADAGKAAAMLSFSENDDGRTAEVRVGETVEVTLAENASTGYRWTVDRLDAGVVRQLSAESHNAAKAIGAPGTIVFTFEAVKAGTGEIASNIGGPGKATPRSPSVFAFASACTRRGRLGHPNLCAGSSLSSSSRRAKRLP